MKNTITSLLLLRTSFTSLDAERWLKIPPEITAQKVVITPHH
jgi:hypothetical protein